MSEKATEGERLRELLTRWCILTEREDDLNTIAAQFAALYLERIAELEAQLKAASANPPPSPNCFACGKPCGNSCPAMG